MATEFNTSLPSIRRVHSAIKEKEEVEVKLLSGDEIHGTVKWLDDHCICLATTGNPSHPHNMLIWYHAIAFIKTKG